MLNLEAVHGHLDQRKQSLAKTPWGVQAFGNQVRGFFEVVDRAVDSGFSLEEKMVNRDGLGHLARDAGQEFFRLGMMTQNPWCFAQGAMYFQSALKMTEDMSPVHMIADVEKNLMEAMDGTHGSQILELLRTYRIARSYIVNPDAIFALSNWMIHDARIPVTQPTRKRLSEDRTRAWVLRSKKAEYNQDYQPKFLEKKAAKIGISGYNFARDTILSVQRVAMLGGGDEKLLKIVREVTAALPGKFDQLVAE